MFALVVRFDLIDAEKAIAFDKLVAETVAAIRESEPGTLVYATHVVEDEPLARVFYEVYADQAAHRTHEQQPHTRRFLDERHLYTAGVRVEFLTPSAEKGLPA
ncbi:antibiotic biosynthesis monooxygenase [Nocardia panacis]|uniref:Antibiotic biosynthesis monooxygenase n=1 Tax=Nocardia panacis TaxID=2340916 RepID=A0A3A4JZQ5_9NOCA|nr:antibiotic biosynthesis monooxygenase [Nocardia panacis]RJO76965.1 antibiotic biosynthesis monooxygenase [Nocardia panacis]